MSEVKKPRKDQDFRDVCDYIKKEILQYTDDMKFPKYMVMRIKGLADGKFFANKKTKPEASYDYKTILYTFQICKAKILTAIDRKGDFNNEKHKLDYILVIIESEINDVHMRIKRVKKNVKKVEKMEVDNFTHKGAGYQNKDKKINKKLEELW